MGSHIMLYHVNMYGMEGRGTNQSQEVSDVMQQT